tara:strand:+ start:163 stop:1077 length:915 start_codon:yes stop_codon:yes gene_type:complete
MKKYSYWNYVKTGGWQVVINFFHNKKTYCCNHHSTPIFTSTWRPAENGYYIKQWYWQQNGKLKTWYAVQDFSTYNKTIDICFPEWFPNEIPQHQWFYESPFISSRGRYSMKDWGKLDGNIDDIPTTFYDCAEHLLEHDSMNNPHVMFGYNGSLGGEDTITKNMEDLDPPHPPADLKYIVNQFKLRYNIVPYKEDLESLVEGFLRGCVGDAHWKRGQDHFVSECVRKLKNHRKTYGLITRMLEYHGIPYLPFNLDRDNYQDFFELDDWLPMDKCIRDHNTTLDNHMPLKRQLKLPQLIDQVLCSL